MHRGQARRRAAGAPGSGAAGARDDGFSRVDELAEVTAAELEEFLAADQEPVAADPVFRKQLRARLWKLIRRASTRGT